MRELTTAANLVDSGSFDDESPVAVLSRSELDAVQEVGGPAQLWLELGRDDDTTLLSLDLSATDIEAMLERSAGDEVYLAFDGDALYALFDDPEVEAHGLRGALAIAVVAGAIAAPAGLAATPQISAAANPQISAAATPQLSAATTPQVSTAATSAQVSNPAAKAQVAKAQVAKTQVAKAQVAKAATSAQISKSLVVKASGIRLLNKQLAR
jgi:hypothetical protein